MSISTSTWSTLLEYTRVLEDVLDALEQQERESPTWRPEYLRQMIQRAEAAKYVMYNSDDDFLGGW